MTYEIAVAEAVVGMAEVLDGNTGPFKTAILRAVGIRGGVVGGGRFVDKDILREVTIEVLDRFMALFAAGLASKAPELGDLDEEIAAMRARLEAQFVGLLDAIPPTSPPP